MGAAETVLTLSALNGLVGRAVEQCFPDTYWVRAELSDVRTNATGHCYLELIEKSSDTGQLLAKARTMVWSQAYRLLKPAFELATGQPFASGIKVQVCVKLTFHTLYGYSLSIIDIDPSYTLGDMALNRQRILQRLAAEGILTRNKELPFPVLPQRVAVVSSATAAGYDDFVHQLESGSRGFACFVQLFPALMQGDGAQGSILKALHRIEKRKADFDVVVIIRGGGAMADLATFDTYELAAACACFPLPILTGIGHERDDTLLDAVAHTRMKTPTAAAEFLLEQMSRAVHRLNEAVRRWQNGVALLLNRERYRLRTLELGLLPTVQRTLVDRRHHLDSLHRELQHRLSTRLTRERHRLELLNQQLTAASPIRLLQRGYSLTLKEGRPLMQVDGLQAGDRLVTLLPTGVVHSNVVSIEPTNNPFDELSRLAGRKQMERTQMTERPKPKSSQQS